VDEERWDTRNWMLLLQSVDQMTGSFGFAYAVRYATHDTHALHLQSEHLWYQPLIHCVDCRLYGTWQILEEEVQDRDPVRGRQTDVVFCRNLE